MESHILITRGEENVSIAVVSDDGVVSLVGYADHDEHGWDGMDALERMATEFGKALQWEVKEGGTR